MSRSTGLVLIVLAALAVGYVVGSGRSITPEGRAFAGPTLITGNHSLDGSGTWINANADGDILTVWRFSQSRVISASRCYFHDSKTVNADFTTPAPGK